MAEQEHQQLNTQNQQTQQTPPQIPIGGWYYNKWTEQWFYSMAPYYYEIFQATLQLIQILKKYKHKKWTEQQTIHYMQCLLDIQKYIYQNIFTGKVVDYNVYQYTLICYGEQTNPVGYQLYINQLQYMQKKQAGQGPKQKKDPSQETREFKPRQFVEEKQPIRKDDPVQDLQQMASRDWSEGKYISKELVLKQNANLVFIGHVDAGKSTLTGNLLRQLKQIDQQQLARNIQEAKASNMEAWTDAFNSDIDPNQRRRGKTIQCAKLMFVLQKRRFTLFDAPGHKNYVPNMIMGACQADIAVLIISAKDGQFQSGFEKQGQTKQHAMLAKALGVQGFIVVVTKMGTVNWSQKRFTSIKTGVTPFLENSCGFTNVQFIPIDSITNDNIYKRMADIWYKGPCLIEILNEIKIPERNLKAPLRIPIIDKFKDQGVLYLHGKIQSGIIEENQTVSLLPKRNYVIIKDILNAKDQKMPFALAGENVKLRVKGIQEDDVNRGDVICNNLNFCQESCEFKADLNVLELPQSKKLVSSGYECVIHMHAIVQQVQIASVQAKIDTKTNKSTAATFLKPGQTGKVLIKVSKPVCLEKFDFMPGLGRFTLRDEGKTIGYGWVTKIKPAKKLTNEQKQQLLGGEKKGEDNMKEIDGEKKKEVEIKQEGNKEVQQISKKVESVTIKE